MCFVFFQLNGNAETYYIKFEQERDFAEKFFGIIYCTVFGIQLACSLQICAVIPLLGIRSQNVLNGVLWGVELNF